MDYKYIEQLIEKYLNADTSLQEEKILKVFFEQPVLPTHLMVYKDLFGWENERTAMKLSEKFDERIMKRIEGEENRTINENAPQRVRAKRRYDGFSMAYLFKAAASVAIVALVGLAAQRSFSNEESVWDYNPDAFKDTYESEQQAYTAVENSLDCIYHVGQADSTEQLDMNRQKKLK